MKSEEWRYLIRELVLHYSPSEITKHVGTNKTSVHSWIKGESSPKFKNTQKKLLQLSNKIENPHNLINKSREKERKLDGLSKLPIIIWKRLVQINTSPLIVQEIKRREKYSADKWYVMKITQNEIIIRYFDNHKNWRITKAPLKIIFNEYLAKIIGFWLGDGTTKNLEQISHRPYISLTNSDISVLQYLKRFFSSYGQKSDLDIELQRGELANELDYNKFLSKLKKLALNIIERVHGPWNGFGAMFHVRNSPLSLIFRYIEQNIENILKKSSSKVKAAFLGGYFTADGSVSKINQWFTFSETKRERRELIISLLKELGFGNRKFPPTSSQEQVKIAYRNEIRENDFKLFRKLILPNVFSMNKVKTTNELFEKSNMREIDLIYLFYLYLHSNSTSNDIRKAFCKDIDYINRIYRRLENSKIKLVERKRSHITAFFNIDLTPKGLEIVTRNLDKIKNIASEIKKVSIVNRGYKGTFYVLDPTKSKVAAINELFSYFNL